MRHYKTPKKDREAMLNYYHLNKYEKEINKKTVARDKERYHNDMEFKRKENKSVVKRDKQRLKEDSTFAIIMRIRINLLNALNKYSKTGKIMKSNQYLDFEKIIEHLKPFPKELSHYEVDHIKPCSLFDFNNVEEIRKCFTPENLQWLTVKENRIKSNRYPFDKKLYK